MMQISLQFYLIYTAITLLAVETAMPALLVTNLDLHQRPSITPHENGAYDNFGSALNSYKQTGRQFQPKQTKLNPGGYGRHDIYGRNIYDRDIYGRDVYGRTLGSHVGRSSKSEFSSRVRPSSGDGRGRHTEDGFNVAGLDAGGYIRHDLGVNGQVASGVRVIHPVGESFGASGQVNSGLGINGQYGDRFVVNHNVGSVPRANNQVGGGFGGNRYIGSEGGVVVNPQVRTGFVANEKAPLDSQIRIKNKNNNHARVVPGEIGEVGTDVGYSTQVGHNSILPTRQIYASFVENEESEPGKPYSVRSQGEIGYTDEQSVDHSSRIAYINSDIGGNE